MKRPFYHLTLLAILLSCGREQKETSDTITNLAELTLHLKGYAPSSHKSFIDLTVENSINPVKKQLKIQDDGIVTYSFINPKDTELLFQYEDNSFSLIVAPGDEVAVQLDLEELTRGLKLDDFSVTGKNAVTNNLILSNRHYLDSLIGLSSAFYSRDGTLQDIGYKVLRVGQMNSQLGNFDAYVVANNIKDQKFIDWSRARIRYNAAHDLCVHPFYGVTNRKIFIDDEYFSFFEEVNDDGDAEIIYHDYLKYIEALSTSLRIMSNVSDRIKAKREQLKEDSVSTFPILFNMIKRVPVRRDRQMVMAYAFQGEKNVPTAYRDSLKYFVSDGLISQLNKGKQREKKPLLVLLEDYDIPQVEKEELVRLYEDTRDRVVFHDFWFTNCGPCIRELPNYNALMKSTGPNVAFVFYGAYMNEDEWQAAIEKFNLGGKHHLLTKNQLAFFERYFGLHGFPHHQIINIKGEIVDEQIPAAIPENFEQISALIRKNELRSPVE